MKRDSLVLAIAILCGLAAFGLIYNFLKSASVPATEYVMTTNEFKKGKVLTDADLTISPPFKNLPSANYFTQMYEVIGMELQEDAPKNKLINRSMVKKVEIKIPEKIVAENNEAKSLPVPAGMRALTLGLSELENPPYDLISGSYVDVLGSTVLGSNQREVRTLVYGLSVLNVERDEKTRQIQQVTVAVPPTQIESIVNASKAAKIRLVITTQPASSDMVYSGSVEIIRGVQRERKMNQ